MPKITARRANVILLALVLVVGIGNLWATHDDVDASAAQQKREQAQQQAAQKTTQQRQEVLACRQFGGLVESIVRANADTQHAVKASKSFGQLFSVAVQRYYSQTGCSRYFVVGG